jgi:mannosyltransferase
MVLGYRITSMSAASIRARALAEHRGTIWVLTAITMLSLFLRLLHLGSDLWLDEILTLDYYCRLPILDLLTRLDSFNNHLLNTLLIKGTVALFGESEWAARLPAVIVGTATIPMIYWVARLFLSRSLSLGAALLLALSYHHIFFSQNARGYALYLFFSLLSVRQFVEGLRRDRMRNWLAYAAAMFANFASLLTSVFVYAAHIMIAGLAILKGRVAARAGMPIPVRAAAVFAALALLGGLLYWPILPQTAVVTKEFYGSPGSGYGLYSGGLRGAVIQGVTAGLGTPRVLLLLVCLAVVLGCGLLLRRECVPTLALLLPPLLHVGFAMIRHLSFSPRFFILLLPLAIIAAVEFVRVATDSLFCRPGGTLSGFRAPAAAGLVLSGAVLSALSLPGYYASPKQDYRGAIRYVQEHRQKADVVIALKLACRGIAFYGRRLGFAAGQDYVEARSLSELDGIIAANPGQRPILLVTLLGVLTRESPEIVDRVRRDWVPLVEFHGTLGDGTVSIWIPRTSGPR